MKTVGVRELKNRLSEYIRQVRSGESVLVTNRGEVVAELAPPGHTTADGEVPAALVALAKRGLRPSVLQATPVCIRRSLENANVSSPPRSCSRKSAGPGERVRRVQRGPRLAPRRTRWHSMRVRSDATTAPAAAVDGRPARMFRLSLDDRVRK